MTYYTTQNCGGITRVVIIYTAIYQKYGVKPHKISTIVDVADIMKARKHGVKPHKISTIVDIGGLF